MGKFGERKIYTGVFLTGGGRGKNTEVNETALQKTYQEVERK